MDLIVLWDDIPSNHKRGLAATGWTEVTWNRMQRVSCEKPRHGASAPPPLRSVPQLSYEMELSAVKASIRPGLALDGWGASNYQHKLRHLTADGIEDDITRIDVSKVSVGAFTERYMLGCRPVVITGAAEGWGQQQGWCDPANWASTLEGVWFRVGSDDHSEPVSMRAESFMQYVNTEAEGHDNPLYLFQHLGEDMTVKAPKKGAPAKRGAAPADLRRHVAMADDYEVPKYFQPDLFECAGQDRPPYRWVCMGPKFTGSDLHIDPLASCAWNTVLSGCKYWLLFPPDTPEEVLRPPEDENGRAARIKGASAWYYNMLPRVLEPDFPVRPIQVVQRPGETIFVPKGWWHAVLNLDLTLSITQNLAAPCDLAEVWDFCLNKRSWFMSEWSNHLKATWPAAMDKMPENSAAAITRPNAQQQKDAFTKFGNGMLDVSQTIKALKHLFDGMGVTKTTQQIQSQVYVLMDQVSEDGDELSLGEFVQLVDLAIP